MYYLRKISRGRWPEEDRITKATLRDIEADTVTAELRTDKNRLSVWQIETEEDLLDAFVALGSNCEHIGAISAVKMKADDLSETLFECEEGVSPTYGINEKHRNIKALNYVLLGDVAMSVVKGLQSDGYVRKTKGDMKKLFVDAYNSNKLDMSKMSPTLEKEIMAAVASEKNKM